MLPEELVLTVELELRVAGQVLRVAGQVLPVAGQKEVQPYARRV